MYRAPVVSFRSKLLRLEAALPPPAAPCLGPARDPDRAPDPRSATLDSLRQRIAAVLTREGRPPRPRPPVDCPDLPFLTEQTPLGPLHVRSLRLSAAHRTGRAPVLAARDASASLLALLALDPALAACPARGALYPDTETTGLSGGTGTIAYLVGIAFWDEAGAHGGGDLVVEQLLVRNFGEEAPMLARLTGRIADATMLVTFNGKAFDMPLLRTRYAMAKMALPREPPHLDLVHVARRLHKARGIAHKLTTIEREVLGFERVDDVPGSEVSARYLHFLRTGDAAALLGVVEHNAWDVVAMAALVGLYGEPLEATTLAAEDLVGVARTLARAGQRDEAFDMASRAIDAGAGAAGLRARADIAKARGDRARAMADFEALATQVDDPAVRLELAKLYEHHVKEPARALALTLQGTGEHPEQAGKRKRRLTKKVERSADGQGSLFRRRKPAT
jgi:uncharacterized protein YprB with RNaseH-like and TPR domain